MCSETQSGSGTCGSFYTRDPETVKILTETAKVCHVDEAEKMKDEIDV